jgi:3-phenylpropionate/cinnamic acid dioxygenase small subunit
MSFVDRLKIEELFVRYASALDNGDVETVVGCFTADAALESPAIGRISGTAAIRDFAEQFRSRLTAGAQFRHMITNLAVTVEPGDERAHATAYLLVLITRNGAHRTLPPGRYECELVREGNAWRFSRRTVSHDHDYSLDEA